MSIDENNEISNLLISIKNLQTEESKDFDKINEQKIIQNLNYYNYNNMNYDDQLEVIVEQADTIRTSSNTNTGVFNSRISSTNQKKNDELNSHSKKYTSGKERECLKSKDFKNKENENSSNIQDKIFKYMKMDDNSKQNILTNETNDKYSANETNFIIEIDPEKRKNLKNKNSGKLINLNTNYNNELNLNNKFNQMNSKNNLQEKYANHSELDNSNKNSNLKINNSSDYLSNNNCSNTFNSEKTQTENSNKETNNLPSHGNILNNNNNNLSKTKINKNNFLKENDFNLNIITKQNSKTSKNNSQSNISSNNVNSTYGVSDFTSLTNRNLSNRENLINPNIKNNNLNSNENLINNNNLLSNLDLNTFRSMKNYKSNANTNIFMKNNNIQNTVEENIPEIYSKNNLCVNLDNNFINVNNIKKEKTLENKQTPYEYLQDIFENMLNEEKESFKLFGYMKNQNDLNEKMRAILVDWIIEVHYKFKLMQETLFLTVNLIDRILNFKKLDRKQLQLIGVSAMLIACKYEEIYSPELRDFVYITDKSYEADEIIKMESEILNYLKFEVCFPSVNRFFEILSIILNFTDKEIVLGRYLMDLFLIDYRYTKYNSSLIACSICYLIKKDERKDKLNDLINLSLSDIGLFKECIKDICFILEYVDQEKLLSIKKKYSSRDNYQFSKIKMKDLL